MHTLLARAAVENHALKQANGDPTPRKIQFGTVQNAKVRKDAVFGVSKWLPFPTFPTTPPITTQEHAKTVLLILNSVVTVPNPCLPVQQPARGVPYVRIPLVKCVVGHGHVNVATMSKFYQLGLAQSAT